MAQRLRERPVRSGRESKKAGGWVGAILLGYLAIECFTVSMRLARFRLSISVVPAVLGFLFFGLAIGLLVGKKKKKTGEEPRRSPRMARTEKFSFDGDDHLHILPTDLSTQKRLEQLETLRGAGLYTREEYLVEKRKILNGGKP